MPNNELSVTNPFEGQRNTGVATGTVMARESTEVLAMISAAKRNPRDPVQASDRIQQAFTRTGLAEMAQYQYARGGTDITGPSIRAAEAIRIGWGNLSAGWREVSRDVGADGVGMSEVEAFCVDYESTTREAITFWVRHWRDTKRGGYALKDERDIYELCANQASRRKRACILALVPGDVIEMAMEQASVTLRTKADTSPEAMKKMLEAFAPFGVTREMVEKRLQRKLDAIQPAQVVGLKRIYASLRDEMSVAADWFQRADPEPPPAGSAARVAELLKKPPGAATGLAADPPAPTPPPQDPAARQERLQRLVARVQQAENIEYADSVLDQTRDEEGWTPADRATLEAAYTARWQPTPEQDQ